MAPKHKPLLPSTGGHRKKSIFSVPMLYRVQAGYEFRRCCWQKQRLRISVNMKFSQVVDPNGICHDITGVGRWGNGDVELFMEHTSDIDRVMEIIEQSYSLQAD